MNNSTPPPPTVPQEQILQDNSHIKTLVICHYIMAGLCALGLLFLFAHFMIMNSFMSNPEFFQESTATSSSTITTPSGTTTTTTSPSPIPPEKMLNIFKYFYLTAGLLIILGLLANILSAHFMHKRKHKLFSQIVAGINCLSVPLGTILGIFTFIVLGRPSIQASYDAPQN